MARRGPRWLRWLAPAVVAVALAACSNNPKPSSSASGTSPTSRPSPPSITYPHNWTIESVDSSGATWTTNVATADVVSGKALRAYESLYGDRCNLDPGTDAIVPFQITTTGTASGTLTASGDQELKVVNASLGAAPDGSDAPTGGRGTESEAGFTAGEVLRTAEASSSGPTCSSLDPPAETMTLGNDALTNGQQVVLKGYFDLKHWAAPASEHGDPSWLPNIWIFVPTSGSSKTGNSWETTSVSGPAVVSLLDFTPTATYNALLRDDKNDGYGWAFPIDARSQPDCARADASSPSGTSLPSKQSLCEALPEQVVLQYLSNHAEITDATARALTGITAEDSMKAVFSDLQKKGEIEMVPGKSGAASAWRKKQSS